MSIPTKEEIVSACEVWKAQGYALQMGDWGSTDEQCGCALTALAYARGVLPDYGFVDLPAKSAATRAASALGVDRTWVVDFTRGFDYIAGPVLPTDGVSDAFKLGHDVQWLVQPVDPLGHDGE